MNTNELLTAISRKWRLSIHRLRPDLPLAGSPERTAWRSVVETTAGRLYVLEKIPSRVYGRKRRIAGILQRLCDLGLKPVVPYLPDTDGDPIGLVDHGLWQLSDYVGGIALARPAYVMDGWRGDRLADFLVDLHAVHSHLPLTDAVAPFSILAYSRELHATMARRKPQVASRYRPFIEHVQTHLRPVHDRLPVAFCHGDLHPLNVIWGKRTLRAVIDWEFCGIKPEIFDLANLLGCLGIEDPMSLKGPFVQRLIRRLQGAGIFAEVSWQALPDLILAIRFAWLSEWLRKEDRPMIRLEADYMALLRDSRAELARLFSHLT